MAMKRKKAQGSRQRTPRNTAASKQPATKKTPFLVSAKPLNLPVCFVILLCALFALKLGALEPDFRYQQTGAQVLSGNCTYESALGHAFAFGNTVIVPLMHKSGYSVSAGFA